MLFAGTTKRPNRFLLNTEKDLLGAASNASTSREWVNFFIQAANEHVEHMTELLSDMVLNSLLEKESLDKEKDIILEELQRAEHIYPKLTTMVGLHNLFENTPLARYPLGNMQNIKKATIENIKKYYQQLYTPNNSALVFTGAIAHDEAVRLAQKYFAIWQAKPTAAKEVLAESKIKEPYFFQKEKIKRTFILWSFLNKGYTDLNELLTLDILKTYLSYGQSSLLMQELRAKKGLVYGITAINYPFSDAGAFCIGTETSQPIETISTIHSILKNIHQHIPRELFEKIKKQRINIFIRWSAEQLNQTNHLGESFIYLKDLMTPEIYIKRLEALTYEESISIIEKCLRIDNSLLTVVGPKDIKKKIRKIF
jgi:predicted Zn-dependent peptidase